MSVSSISLTERILLFAAGTDPELYARCTPTEQNKLITNGIFVFIPALMAVFSGGFAAPLLFDSGMGQLLFPWIYGSLIFVLDRSIMIYVKPGERSFAQVCRLGLAMALSLLLAEPLVLQLFKDALIEEEERQKDALTHQFDSLLQVQIMPLEEERKSLDKKVDNLSSVYIQEADGNSGTHQRGLGKIALEKKAAWEKAKIEADIRKDQIATEKMDLTRRLRERNQTVNKAQATGVMGKVRTLHRLAGQDAILMITSWLLRLILAIFDILPVLLKLQAPKSKADNLYGYLSDKKNIAQLDSANALFNLHFATALQQQKLVAQQQLNASEFAYFQQVAADMQRRIGLLIEQQKTAEQIRQETLLNIKFQVKNPDTKRMLLEQLEIWFNEYMQILNKAANLERKVDTIGVF